MDPALQHDILHTLWTLTAAFALLAGVMLVSDIFFPEKKEPPYP